MDNLRHYTDEEELRRAQPADVHAQLTKTLCDKNSNLSMRDSVKHVLVNSDIGYARIYGFRVHHEDRDIDKGYNAVKACDRGTQSDTVSGKVRNIALQRMLLEHWGFDEDMLSKGGYIESISVKYNVTELPYKVLPYSKEESDRHSYARFSAVAAANVFHGEDRTSPERVCTHIHQENFLANNASGLVI